MRFFKFPYKFLLCCFAVVLAVACQYPAYSEVAELAEVAEVAEVAKTAAAHNGDAVATDRSWQQAAVTPSAQRGSIVHKAKNLTDFGEANWPRLIKKLKNSKQQTTHIMQFGDSHTAADIFSGQMRRRLQAEFGDGGIGLVPPGAFSGIRQDTVKIRSSMGWGLLSTRNPEAANFSPSGYYALPLNDAATIGITRRAEPNDAFDSQDANGQQNNHLSNLSILYKAGREARLLLDDGRNAFLNSSDGAWVLSEALDRTRLPLELRIQSRGDFMLGGIYLANQRPSGVIYSALGVNGATLMDWDKWNTSWPQTLQALAPDMVILEYGTNEAFSPLLDLSDYRDLLTRKIRAIRQALPNAVILIIGTPDSLRAMRKPVSTNSTKNAKNSKPVKARPSFDCRVQRPPNLANVIDIQREVARQEKTLYWSWQDYMGGVCSMYQWSKRGLARDDLVHFLTDGYRMSADALFNDVRALGAFR